MPVAPGSRIGPYEIVSALGAGGMGEVFRAHDRKLNRDVAIKVLPDAFARDANRVARFKREAQVLASLNHTNIAAIYGLEETDDTLALALEFVAGEDLAQRLARGPIPIDESLAIARQVAEGLEAAHERGIVHRDLKPANIKVTPDGSVKILDFGLAKAMLGADDAGAQASIANSPTITSPAAMTALGVILGTAAYMSPEQARGAAADRRADLWAFGAVLMEMLTGRPLFAGETIGDVLAAVLTRDVDWTTLPAATPTPIRRLLRRCLEKDRRKRIADAASARLEIDDALANRADAPTEAGRQPGRPSLGSTLLRVVAPSILVTAIAVGGAGWYASTVGAPVAPLTLSIVPPEGMQFAPVGTMDSPPHLSPDGSAIMFVVPQPDARSKLFVRRLTSIEAIPVPGSAGVTNEPFWHGSSRVTFPVYMGAGRQLLDVLLPDGAPELVMTYSANLRGGSWRGQEVVVGGAALLGPAGDRTAKVLKVADLRYPEFIPGTELFLAWRQIGIEGGEVCLATLTKGEVTDVTPLFKNDTAARYTPSGGGRVLFVRNDSLYAQRLNVSAGRVEGDAEVIAKGVASQPGLGRADFSVADNGTVAWRPGRAGLSEVVTLDRAGVALGKSGPPGAIDGVYVSPGAGSRLLVAGPGQWLAEVGDAGRSVLPGDVDWSFWTSTGRLAGLQQNTLVIRDAAGGPLEKIGRLPPVTRAWALSPDGQVLLAKMKGKIYWARVSSMSDPQSWTPLSDVDEGQADSAFSPDGRFVVYDSDAGLYVQPFPGPGRRQRIGGADPGAAEAGGADPVWRGDGKEIAYLKGDAVWSVGVSATAGGLALGEPRRLFGGLRANPSTVFNSQNLAVSPDGSRFYVIQGVEQPATNVIHVIVGGARH